MNIPAIGPWARAGRLLAVPITLLLSVLLSAASDGSVGPRYTADGKLIPPADYREWVYMSTGLNMSYTDEPETATHSLFDNVFVDPRAWAAFKRTGHWPDQTMFVLEVRGASSKGSILKHGLYQTDDDLSVEMHVHDEARFKGGWGFFRLSGSDPAALLPAEAPCYACHLAHGTVDTTFTQFYPVARAIAARTGTLRGD